MGTSKQSTGSYLKFFKNEIKQLFIDQFKKIEEKTIIQLTAGIISLGIVLIGLLADLQQIPISTRNIVIIILFVVMFSYGLGNHYLARKRLVDLESSKKETSFALKLIRRAAENSPTNYVVTERETIYDIQESGDVIYTRMMKFRPTNDSIPWAIIHIGVVDGNQEILPKSNLMIIDPFDKSELAYTFIENRPPFKKIAILLDPPMQNGNKNGLQFTQVIQKAYIDLIEGRPDEGKLEINNITDSCIMKFIAPRGKEFSNIHWLDRIIGRSTITMSDDQRSTLIWKRKNIPLGSYRYTLKLK